MLHVHVKEDCCGCTACFNACPARAITMEPDSEGFVYPKINRDKCVKCDLCERVCPILHKENHTENTEGYIIRYRDTKIVEESTSGGAFTAFATFLLGKGYVVYGTGYDTNMQVICKMALKPNELDEMRGSKFVQSNLGTTFQHIRKQLQDGRKVLFTGTPCQISGLISYLGGKPNNLLCIDFVCRGVSSPNLWKNYVSMMERKYDSKIVGAKFKNKTYGYHGATMKINFANGKIWYGSGRVDPMLKAYVTELASRPSCHKCVFKSIERQSDITMFDCYNFSKITGKKDDNKGYTSLLVHSKQGSNLLNVLIDKLIIYKTNVPILIKENGIMVCNSSRANDKRNNFFELASRMSIDQAMYYISPITRKDILIERMKGILQKLGLIKMARKLKKEKIKIN